MTARLMGLCLAALLMTLPRGAGAAPATDPDSEVARRHFQRGTELYEAGRYAEAAVEFKAAADIKPLPAFAFNIGRCMERLERWGEAIAAFERYLPAADPKERDELRARLVVLRERAARASHGDTTPHDNGTNGTAASGTTPPDNGTPGTTVSGTTPPATGTAPAAARSSWRLRGPALGVGILAVAAAGVAAGLVGSVAGDFDAKKAECRLRACSDADVAPLARRLDAGYALFAIAGAAAIADAVLIALVVKERRERPRAMLVPVAGGAAFVLDGRF